MTRVLEWVDGAQVIRDMTPDELAEYNRSQEPDRTAMQLTFAQLLIGLVAEGIITEAEGDGWLAGTLPAGVTAVINTLPKENRFPAKARAQRPTTVDRLNPLVAALAASRGLDDASLDAFFTRYALA
jgi:hypothetical protein